MLPIAPFAKTIYLDNAATTPLDNDVLATMLPYFGGEYSNPSSLHSSGRRARRAIATARVEVAAVLNSLPEEIIFTGSGTEADNLAILGVARANQKFGRHVIISAIEHKAIMEAVEVLRGEGFEISVAPVDRDGLVSVTEVMSLVRPETILISVMFANNEVGTIQPIAELAEAVRTYRAGREFPLVHTDACQAAGTLSIDVRDLGVDLMTINSSKIYGPKGVGVLFKRRGVRLSPQIVGGEQESNQRAGTESVPLIVGLATALRLVEARREVESVRLAKLRDYFIERLLAEIPGLVLNGHSTKRLPNNVHISIPYIEGESLLLMLDYYGIEVGTGSACSALDLRPSHVLLAIGQSLELVHGSLRFSLGKDTSQSDIDNVMSVLPGVVEHLTKMSALTTKVIIGNR